MVTVILNSYNQAQFLAAAVESVLSQTYADLELLAIDNGSTDSSPDILRAFASDPRVQVISHPTNAPITQRFNEAVRTARGEFVSFLYSDDFYLPHKLQRQVALFRALPEDYGVVYSPPLGLNEATGHRWTHGSIAASGDVFAALMLRWERGEMDMISPLTRRSALLECPFDEATFAEGEAIFHHLALSYRFAYLDEPLAVARDQGRNAGKAMKRNCEMSLQSLARLRRHPHMDAAKAKLVDRYEGSMLRAYGWQAARLAPDRQWARHCLRRSVAVSPREAIHPKTLGALVLTLFPDAVRGPINRLGHRMKDAPGQAVYIAEYEGLGTGSDQA